MIKAYLLLLFFYIPYLVASPSTQKQVLFLEKGESHILTSPELEKVWISKGGVISLQDRGSYLKIQARKEGKVLLSAGSRRYSIYVLSPGKKKNIQLMSDFLSQRQGLEIQIIENILYIRGKLYRLKDFIDLSKQAQTINFTYVFDAEILPELRPDLQKYIYNTAKHLPPFKLSWQRPLVAFIPKDTEARYEEALKHLGLTLKKDASLLPVPQAIKLKILLVESSDSQALQNHLDLGGNLINQILEGQIFEKILSSFKSAESRGEAHILSEASLLGESGKNTYFHSGGEVPIPNFNPESDAQSIKWKPYGIRIKCKATADRNEKIHIQTEVEISEVDHVHSAQGAPALKSNRIHSSITMKNGQTLLLSKLLRKQKGKSYAGPLEITQIPFAGQFLSFKGMIKEHTRLHIFIKGSFK